MTNTREKLLKAITEYGRYRPEVRLLQTLLGAMATREKTLEMNPYDVEDEDLLASLEETLVIFRNRDWSAPVSEAAAKAA